MREEDDEKCEEEGVQEPCEGAEPCSPACLPLRERRSRYRVCRLVVRARNEERRRRRSFLHGGLVAHRGCKEGTQLMSGYITGWIRGRLGRVIAAPPRTRPQLTSCGAVVRSKAQTDSI